MPLSCEESVVLSKASNTVTSPLLPGPHPIMATSVDLLDSQQFDVVEAFFEVRLHSLRVTGLAQNLQQVIVGQEVEAREHMSLGL